jgi:hypothetical protein
MEYEVCETDCLLLEAEDRRTDLHVESFNLTRDGSVDQYGRVADKRKTGGWKAAPLIFGTFINLKSPAHYNFEFCPLLKKTSHKT